ncbi:hypothetical protein IVB33_29095 [Bradyrhizobium sp. 24]|uniref:hypothetical protein n=1 Tax=unclassified Bradyrhizobium TaxID=2631580 RepID=UPI001FFBB943|nr:MULTISPECIES: hypothetical protein [unclassified Bradyrhizobium]MCK1302936.1 hypothetical protein [Bradyrhizobium sp. 37]MCK1381009.1 hypothetical protein [Bradyrhizobium sp. 24]MCK1772432.1 hypothetical protein [Bradyrhizobium sp. 134]
MLSKEIVQTLGGYLSYGAIGLGLAVAVLATILLISKSAAAGRFMQFALVLVVIGSGVELLRIYAANAATWRVFVASQNLPDEFWNDFLLSRQQKMFGLAEPTDEYTSGSFKEGDTKTVQIHIPKGECRYYFAAVRPPAKVSVQISDNESNARTLRATDYYRTGKICVPSASSTHEIGVQVQMTDSDGQFSISAFKAPPEEEAPPASASTTSQTTPQANPSPVPTPTPTPAPQTKVARRVVCTGEFEANCAGPHDAFFTCGFFGGDDQIASQMCKGSPSNGVRINTKGGNKCGYSLIEVTCG